MRVAVTGGAGFIGSHLVDFFLRERNFSSIIVLDNLNSSYREFSQRLLNSDRLIFHRVDLRFDDIGELLSNVDVVFHFAANPEVRIGSQNPEDVWSNNVVATYNLLEAIRRRKVKYFVFASSSTVYGDATEIPTPENYTPLEPVSIYGASKLACEALISGYAHTFKIRSLVIRYANIVGSRLRHGVIYDFIMKLKKNPSRLVILGDGTQRKSYLHISDAIDATVHLFNVFREGDKIFDVYNVGNYDWITVREIAEIVAREMNLNPRFEFTGGINGGRGWIGDVKYMLLDISKLKSTGWEPRLSSRQAVKKAVRELISELS